MHWSVWSFPRQAPHKRTLPLRSRKKTADAIVKGECRPGGMRDSRRLSDHYARGEVEWRVECRLVANVAADAKYPSMSHLPADDASTTNGLARTPQPSTSLHLIHASRLRSVSGCFVCPHYAIRTYGWLRCYAFFPRSQCPRDAVSHDTNASFETLVA
jgi:hypothetical protein